MEQLKALFENGEIERTSKSTLHYLFQKVTYYENIIKLLKKYPKYKTRIYDNVEYVDFLGYNLIQDNEPTPDELCNRQIFWKFDINKLNVFTNLRGYRISTKNKDVLRDVRAKHLEFFYDGPRNYDKMVEDLIYALKIRTETYGTQFTLLFNGSVNSSGDLFFFYKDGLLHIHNKWDRYDDISKIFPVIFGNLRVLEIFNLDSNYLKDIASFKIDTLSYNVLDLLNLDKTPDNIKKILFYTTTDRNKRETILNSRSPVDYYGSIHENILVFEFPIEVNDYISRFSKILPNVKVFHSINEYKIKTLEISIAYYNRMIQGFKENYNEKIDQKLHQRNLDFYGGLVTENAVKLELYKKKLIQDIEKGKEKGVEIYPYGMEMYLLSR